MITLAKLPELLKISIAIVITWMFHRYNFSFQPSDISTLAGVIAGSSGTILGFLITAIALMASVMDRDLLRNLRSTGGYRSLISSSFLCACLFLILLASSVCLLLPWGNNKQFLLLLNVFIGSLAAIQLASTGMGLYRIIMLISRI